MFFELASELRRMTAETSSPRDLPGRYGRVVRDLERSMEASETLAVVAGGWAVWRHGYAGRVTEDIDLVVPDDKVADLQTVAAMAGFEILSTPSGRWPKLLHRQTQIEVDLLPQHGIPGVPSRPAPVAIRHPSDYGAEPGRLRYISLAGLIELKLGAARARDIADIIELIKQNQSELDGIRHHLNGIHPDYEIRFQQLIQQAREEGGE